MTLKRAVESLGMLVTNPHHTLNFSGVVYGCSPSRLRGSLLPPVLEFFADHQHRLFTTARPVTAGVRADSTFLPARGTTPRGLSKYLLSSQGSL